VLEKVSSRMDVGSDIKSCSGAETLYDRTQSKIKGDAVFELADRQRIFRKRIPVKFRNSSWFYKALRMCGKISVTLGNTQIPSVNQNHEKIIQLAALKLKWEFISCFQNVIQSKIRIPLSARAAGDLGNLIGTEVLSEPTGI
jgi:hypothetical protein